MNMNSTTAASADNSTVTTMFMMPFHTVLGMDMIWFSSWMPGSAATTLGACAGLFFLAMLYRFLHALRRAAEFNWVKKNKLDAQDLPYFALNVDVLRGVIEGVHSLVGYLLMLAVMLMNAWFFIAIILGITVGEIAFGRFSARGLGGTVSQCC